MNGYQPTKPMTLKEIANPPKGGSGLPWCWHGPVEWRKHVTLKVPNLNLKLGATVMLESVKYTVVELLDNGVELERVDK